MFIKNWYLHRFRLLRAWLRGTELSPRPEPTVPKQAPGRIATVSEPETHRFYADIV